MRKGIAILVLVCTLLCGCTTQKNSEQVIATTLPVYEFTTALCQNTDISVTRLISESISCLHDYALSVNQMRAVENAELVVLSGAGLEDFLVELLSGKTVVDSSKGITRLECHHDHDYAHEEDAHIWLSPENARMMAENICAGLSAQYPEKATIFAENLRDLEGRIDALQTYGRQQLKDLSTRELITFHDGFSYFAHAFDLTILKAIEEESGSEASAAELIELIQLVQEHDISAVFTERNASASAAKMVCTETGAKSYVLDMAMSGDSWFAAMYDNIDTIKEALG